MEVNDQNLQLLGNVLSKTQSLNPVERKQAEEFLKQSEKKEGYALLLLNFINLSDKVPLPLRQASSIAFKNLIKYNWVKDDGKSNISDNDKNKIKILIVDLMLSSPKLVQKQLSEALTDISNHDFPEKWENLVGILVTKMQTNDWGKIIGALKSANSIFKRYRSLSGTESVLKELKNILNHFQEPMLKMYTVVGQMITQTKEAKKLEVLFTVLNLLLKIYLSLNYVDLPEFFEDHLKEYMSGFIVYLDYQTDAVELISSDDEKPGKLHKVLSNICEIINLYASKYEEEFSPYLPKFVQSVWGMLSKASNLQKYDVVVTSSIKYLTSVASGVNYQMFNNQSALQSICEKILIPSMTLRKSDEEVFEDNPMEYIRYDIEGSDSDTRRRSAVELVKGLRKHFESEITQIITSYINNMINQYSENKKKNWRAKDVSIYLVTALTVKSTTAEKGTTSINKLVPIENFYTTQIIPEIISSDSHHIIQADALKFLVTFRLQLAEINFLKLFPSIIKLLSSEYIVVKSYAANCIEKFLTVKDKIDNTYRYRIEKTALKEFLPSLFTSLFDILKKTTTSTPNQYIIKTLMRVINRSQEEIIPLSPNIILQLCALLLDVCKNPINPNFNHYLFESISCLLTSVAKFSPNLINNFEEKLFPIFGMILNQDLVDFTPYAFQLMGQLLDAKKDISPVYWNILPSLLNPTLWENQGNRPSLVNLLQSFLIKGTQKIVQEKDTPNSSWMGILGVWQKLNSTKTNDHNGFELLETIVQHVPPNVWQNFLVNIYTLIFTRLSQNKTPKYVKSFVLFLTTFMVRHGTSIVVNSIDSVKDGIFENVLNNWISEANKFGGCEKKRMIIGLIKLICECPEIFKKYDSKWGQIFTTIFSLLEMPDDSGDDNGEDEVDNQEFTNIHAQLINTIKNVEDPFPQINPKLYFATSLNTLSRKMPGQLNERISKLLNQENMKKMTEYFMLAKIPQPYLL